MTFDMSYKACNFELLELKSRGDDGWAFSGYASTFGNVDEGGDIMMHGAFRDSLRRRPHPKLLWQHDMSEPIGKVVSLQEDDRGLFGEFKLSQTTRGRDAYTLLRDGCIDSMSIGYVPELQAFDKSGARQLKAVDLLEVSVVTLPMNPAAVISAVKSAMRNRRLEAARQVLYEAETVSDGRLRGDESIAEMKRAIARRLGVSLDDD